MSRPGTPLHRWLAIGMVVLATLAPLAAAPRALAQPASDSAAAVVPGEAGIPAPAGFVNDAAGLMDGSSRAKLEAFLDQVKRKTGVEFAVLTVATTAPMDPAEYKVKVFERWGLGARGKDTGLLLLVAVQEHRVWFETGYGLEGTLPDGLQSRIIRDEMTPRFRAGDWTGGITAAVLRTSGIIAREHGVALEWNGQELRYSGRRRSGGVPVGWIAFAIFIVLANIARSASPGTGRRNRGWGPWYGGWGGGFGGGSGGGFGGGGGGSFGGFGGGSSGGGGGGGSW